MKVLVTGGGGFIGINVVRKLLLQGEEVICGIHSELSPSAIRFLTVPNGFLHVEKVDVTDPNLISRIIKKYDINRIVHTAALTPTVEEEKKFPDRVMDVNLMGTVKVLKAASEHNIQRVIFVSSDGIYGPIEDGDRVITEDSILKADGLYGITKIAAESYCRRLQELTGIQIIVGRICATYGPMEQTTLSRSVMSAIYKIAAAAKNGKVLVVHGTQIKRNWTYVDDIAMGLISLLMAEKNSYNVYNLSCGNNYSLSEVLRIFKEIEPTLAYEVKDDDKDVDISYSLTQQRGYLDISRLKNDIGYTPQYDLRAGIEKYLGWLSQN